MKNMTWNIQIALLLNKTNKNIGAFRKLNHSLSCIHYQYATFLNICLDYCKIVLASNSTILLE